MSSTAGRTGERAGRPYGSATASSKHLPQLDALRGLAAFVVVLHHAWLSLPADNALFLWVDRQPALSILKLGRPAVILFFVLSGYVLTLSITQSPTSWWRYALRRTCRIMPAFWAATLFSYLLYRLIPLHQSATMSAWFNTQWHSHIDAFAVAKQSAMLASADQYPLDHVVWSLVHEMRLSLLLPLLLFLNRRIGITVFLIGTGAVTALAELGRTTYPAVFPLGVHGFTFDAPALGASLVITLRFLVCFACGAALALSRDAASRWLSRSSFRVAGVLALGLVVLSLPNEYLMTAGSYALIAAIVASPRVTDMLGFAPFCWLGRISFSLYLVHLPVLLAFGLGLDGAKAPVAVLGAGVVASLVLAEVMHQLVERPGIRFGRWLQRRTPVPVDGLAPPFPGLTGEPV